MPKRGSCGSVLPGCRLSKQYPSINSPAVCCCTSRARRDAHRTLSGSPVCRRRLVLASRLPSSSAPPSNPHSARCAASAQLPATSCLGAFWTPAARARGRGRHAGVQKPCMGLWKSSREFTACDFFLQLNFFVRLESPFLRPDPQCPNAVARRVCQGWPSLRYLLMLSAMPGQTLTNPSTAARSLWSDGRVEGSSLVAHEHS